MNKWFDHAGDRIQFQMIAVWLSVALTAIAAAVALLLYRQHVISGLGIAGVVLLGPLAAALCAWLIWVGTGAGSRGFVHTVTGAGNIKRAPSYSLQESLIARGKYAEAEEAFQTHIAADPLDLDARLACAALIRDHLEDPHRAERLLLEVRSLGPTPAQEFGIANALIDLYRATGQRGREMAELARFAARNRDTEGGRKAKEALGRMKREEG